MTDKAPAARPTLSVVVPCYNEEGNVDQFSATLLPVLEALRPEYSNIDLLLVDDGSSDRTLEELKSLEGRGDGIDVRAVTHGVNKGLGAAIRTGFRETRGDIVVTTDSDGTYPFSEIPKLLSYLTPEIGIVTASPYHPDGGIENVPPHRLVLSRGASVLYRVLVDRKIHTYTALFRAHRREVLDAITFESNDFLACAEILVNARLAGFEIAEMPAILRSRAVGTSKARLARILRSHVRFQGQVLARRMGLGAPISRK
ncbi:MAG: glycosyltransferase family 2 protein [Myxococcales bacterium]|nr:glycosyltransferase family 2 protein [Myxococcales bacterium]